MSSHHRLSLEMDDTRIGLVTSTSTAPVPKQSRRISPTHTTHIHNVFEFHYLLSGEFQMRCNEDLVTLHSGQIIIIAPDIYHYYERYSEDARTLNKQFTMEPIPGRKGTLYSKFASTFLTEQGYCILDADTDLFTRLYLLLEKGNLYEDGAVRYRALMELIFLDLCRPVSQVPESPLPDTDSIVRAYEISEFISNHFAEDITADDMATHLSISRRQLFRCLKDTMNTTWNQLLTRQRIQYAIQLLNEGAHPAQIATQCGFTSYNGFAKAFVRETGYTPAFYSKKRSRNRDLKARTAYSDIHNSSTSWNIIDSHDCARSSPASSADHHPGNSEPASLHYPAPSSCHGNTHPEVS